mgnify:CR=1 FL=1
MCKDNSCIWFALLIAILFNCKSTRGNSSTPLNVDTFFELDSSSPIF